MSAADWTDERVETMRRLRIEKGLSAQQIATALSRTGVLFTRNAVIGKLLRLGIDAPPELRQRRGRASTALAARQRNQGKAKMLAGLQKVMTPEPFRSRHAPLHIDRPNAVRFIDRDPSQCAFFLDSEEGAQGFVCGEPIAINRFCTDCARLAYQPVEKKRAA